MIRKNGSLDFEVNAYTSSSVSTSINFWTQDRQTASLIFKLTKDGVPLPLAAVTGKLVLVMANGSRFIRDITIIDRVEGQAEYILSDKEIKHYGNVQAELNLYYTNDQSMSVHQFSFHISKSLIDQDIVPITEYYVDEFEALRAKINELYEESIQTIKELRDKFEDLEKIETKQGAQSKVDAALAAAKKYTNEYAETPEGAQDKANAALKKSKEYVDPHLENKKIHVTESEKSNWNKSQLYKLTPNDGKVARLPNGTDIFSLPTGFYMGANLVNTPISNDGSFYYVEVLETAYSQDDVNYKRIIVTRSFDNMTWIGTFHAQGFRGWKKTLTVEDVANSTFVDTYDQDNSSVSAAENVATKLVFGATRADDLSEYNRTRAEITLKNSGLYLIRLYITSTNITVGSDNILSCYVNGTEFQRFGNWNPATSSSTCVLYLLQKFKAGDKVTFYITPRGTNKTVSINTSYVTMSQLR
ncbi:MULTISPECIES: BppU family phage baseplate upper protein [unclassified Bacillus (in: firmicutes)]|uniref:BppU family phage baseplate upper protein n=1 Tax=unclassified Bacillus (in: firmicutes) TaxID=185979 RepID=UPI001F0ED944|nr:BppU family phage baseplate upper protein [Bacillus sp. 005/A4HT-01/001]